MRAKYLFRVMILAVGFSLVGCSTSTNSKVPSYNPQMNAKDSTNSDNSGERLQVRERIQVPHDSYTENENHSEDYAESYSNEIGKTEGTESNNAMTNANEVDQKEPNEKKSNEAESKKRHYTWKEVTIEIPASWSGKYTIKEDEDGFSFIQKASQDMNQELGLICKVCRSNKMLPPSSKVKALACTRDTMYYMVLPTEVTYCSDNEQIKQEYEQMLAQINELCSSVKVKISNVHYDAHEYILPLSSTKRITKEEVEGLTDNDLRLARNEIFARHGRVYTEDYLKNYFESCSWYKPKKGMGATRPVSLSKVENANLSVIKQAESTYARGHNYPKRGLIGKVTRVDLNGDGKQERVCIKMNYQHKGKKDSHKIVIQINGKNYEVENDKISFANPEEKYFYITDCSSKEPGLEIALLDYGPSDDHETHFFTFDKKLTYLGKVSGFPFKEYSERNGFSEEGCITGTLRTDLIHTCYSYATWHYDVNKKTIALQESGDYSMVLDGAHELLVDLPVYYDMADNSGTFTMPSKSKVYFVKTDGIEWIKVRGKDGKEGYVKVKDSTIINNGLKASKVFGNLVLCD